MQKTLTKSKFNWRNWFVYIMLVVLIIAFSLLSENFFTLDNFETILRQIAITAVIAFGMTFVITTANIDLSAGSVVGLTGIVVGFTLQAGLGIFLATVFALATGLAVGVLNGILVAKAKIPSFLVTLGMQGIVRGIAMTVTETKPVVVNNEEFVQLWGNGTIAGLPSSVFWMILLFVISIILLNHTSFGSAVKAVGGNKVAAQYSGIKTDKIIILVYVLVGVFSAVAGLMMTARLSNARPEIGAGVEMDAITAVILGGTSLYGGKGKIVNTIVGCLIIMIIGNGLVILGVSSQIQMIVKGAIIIMAVSLSEKQ